MNDDDDDDDIRTAPFHPLYLYVFPLSIYSVNFLDSYNSFSVHVALSIDSQETDVFTSKITMTRS